MAAIPERFHWLFWETSASALDTDRDAKHILPRVLGFGGIDEVRWVIEVYGMEGIHRFLRDVGHPEISERTLRFWRAALKAEHESWATSPAWRKSSQSPGLCRS